MGYKASFVVSPVLSLADKIKPFTLCLECNQPLVSKEKEEVKELVPPYVFETQTQYMQCLLANASTGGVHTGNAWRGS